MTEALSNPALLRLMNWMSPSFPVGAFAYSHGLERAVHDGMVANAAQLEDWLCDLITIGSAWNDAVLLAESWRRGTDGGKLDELVELAGALAGSSERHLETVKQGTAFLEAAAAWPSPVLGRLGPQCPLPVAVGALAGAHRIPLAAALSSYLHAFAANLVQAGLRLMALGQKDGVSVLAALEATIVRTADRAAATTLDDLGGATILAEIAAMNHETQYSRIFRS